MSFPDFPGCVSAGENLEEAMLGAQEALAGHVALMIADGDELPKATQLEEVAQEREASTVAITLIPVVLPGRARRVNVTLDEALLEEIDQISNNRSGFLAEAAPRDCAPQPRLIPDFSGFARREKYREPQVRRVICLLHKR